MKTKHINLTDHSKTDEIIIHFPGGDVQVTRRTDGQGYWAHISRDRHANTGEPDAVCTDVRIDYDMARGDFYHVAVCITPGDRSSVMNAHADGATMADAIALSSPAGRMSKRARKAAQARIADALFGPESGFSGFGHVPTTEEMRAGRIAQLERLLADWRIVYARKLASERQNGVKRAYAEAEAELTALRS